MWKAVLPSKVELFNLAHDATEKNALAGQHPEKMAELQKPIQELALQSVAVWG